MRLSASETASAEAAAPNACCSSSLRIEASPLSWANAGSSSSATVHRATSRRATKSQPCGYAPSVSGAGSTTVPKPHVSFVRSATFTCGGAPIMAVWLAVFVSTWKRTASRRSSPGAAAAVTTGAIGGRRRDAAIAMRSRITQ